jgi:hypothetical protein
VKAQILELVNQKHKSSNGSCGIYFTDFLKKLEISLNEFEELIAEMCNDDEIQIREGIHGFMVMKKKQSNKTRV